MRKRLHESTYFRLVQDTNRNGRRYYAITWHSWKLPVGAEEQVRDMLDPNRNRGANASTWRFRNRDEAEKYYSILLLRWS
jgi:hypothetical protein